jgi:hypothetical protein
VRQEVCQRKHRSDALRKEFRLRRSGEALFVGRMIDGISNAFDSPNCAQDVLEPSAFKERKQTLTTRDRSRIGPFPLFGSEAFTRRNSNPLRNGRVLDL